MTIECSASDSGDFLVVNDRLAILHNCDVSADQSYVIRLPGIGFARQLRRGREEPIHPTGVVARRFLDRVSFNLHFITAAEVNAAIGVVTDVELEMQFEIFKFGITDELWSVAGTDERSILDLP